MRIYNDGTRLTIGHDGLGELAEVLLVREFVLRFQQAMGFHICLYLNDVDEADHVNGLSCQLLWCLKTQFFGLASLGAGRCS